MMGRMRWEGIAIPGVRLFAALALLLTIVAGTAIPAAAQGSVDVAIYTVENGQSAYDACYVIVGYSEVGCDENGDGKVTFAQIPYGTYTVSQTANLGPGRAVADFTIHVTGNVNAEGYEGFTATITGGSGSPSGSSGYSDIAIVTTENGQPAYDACYVIVGYSEVGCDENRDGKITFEDIPLGTWTVRQTANLGPGRAVADFTITVTGVASGDGWERFPATIAGTGGSSTVAGTKDISLITRDPDTGGLLTGTCYILLDYSNEGCDENGDGQVTFDDMPAGTWTVRQTRTPAGYPAVGDFPITIDDAYPNVPVGYLVKQAPQQNTASTRNVSFLFIDSSTSTKIVPTPLCLQLGTVSNVGCDDSLVDGQIDFLDVQTGAHEMAFSNLPAGWQVLGGVGPSTVNIVAGSGPQVVYVQVSTNGTSMGSGSAGGSGSGSGSGAGSIPAGSGAIAVVGGGQTGTASSGAPSTGSGSAGPAVELILDTSGSMNERDQGDQTRLEVAKSVTTRLVTETLPAGVPMALRTYSDCSSSLAIPMGALDPTAATGTIANLSASGSTPIAQSLRAAGNDLQGVTGPKIIVLVTDGEETCGGDPRAEIEALVAQNVDIQVNIVGFAIDDATLTATFQEWARIGNGTYFEASDEIELDQAVTTASQLPFRVLDPQGTVVANGTVGGGSVAVPPGTYAVEIDTNPVTRHDNVVVTAGQTTTIDLGTGTVTGSGGVTASTSDGSIPQAASSPAKDPGDGERTMGIAATGPNGHEIGAQFTVTTLEGGFLGSCTLEGDPAEPYVLACYVSVPYGITVVVTEDVGTITPGTAPVENPLYFDTSTIDGSASFEGVGFQNEPAEGSTNSG